MPFHRPQTTPHFPTYCTPGGHWQVPTQPSHSRRESDCREAANGVEHNVTCVYYTLHQRALIAAVKSNGDFIIDLIYYEHCETMSNAVVSGHGFIGSQPCVRVRVRVRDRDWSAPTPDLDRQLAIENIECLKLFQFKVWSSQSEIIPVD